MQNARIAENNRKQYFEASREIARKWTTFFPNEEFLNAAYWTLFTELFIREENGQSTNYGELTNLLVDMAGVSTPTAHRMIRRAKDYGLLSSRKIPGHGNTAFYELSEDMRKHCETFADYAIRTYSEFDRGIKTAR
jgi:hypothetical protein